MEKWWRVLTVWHDGVKNTIMVEAESYKEANRIAQSYINRYEHIVSIEEAS